MTGSGFQQLHVWLCISSWP